MGKIKINDIENFDDFMDCFKKDNLEDYFTDKGFEVIWDYLVKIQNVETEEEIDFNPKDVIVDWSEYENLQEFNLTSFIHYDNYDDLEWEINDGVWAISCIGKTYDDAFIMSNF